MIERPMLAARAESVEDIWYPCSATPKVDGIRALRVEDDFLTRAFKQVPNRHIRNHCLQLPEGLDGELIVGDCFQSTTSGVMSRAGGPDFTYLVFDYYHPTLGYIERLDRLQQLSLPPFVQLLLPVHLFTLSDLLAFEESCLSAGYEGVITRSAIGPYKFGRSTLRQQYMVKFKRFQDAEGVIVAVNEGHTNMNPVVPNAFGYARRPGGGALKLPRDTCGSLVLRDCITGVEVQVGTGMDEALRKAIWSDRHAYIGKVVKYAYQTTGIKDRPRFPRFIGFRED